MSKHDVRQHTGRGQFFSRRILANFSIITGLVIVISTLVTIWCFELDPHPYNLVYFLMAILTIGEVILGLSVRYFASKINTGTYGQVLLPQQPSKPNSKNRDNVSNEMDRFALTSAQLSEIGLTSNQLQRVSQIILQEQEIERQRMARELHDEAAQTLTSLLIQLRLLEKSHNPQESHLRIKELHKLTRQAMEETRRVAQELSPNILKDLGLASALEWRVEELKKGYSIQVELKIEIVPEHLPENQELVFYRIAQEALNNIARHSQAQNVRISLEHKQELLTLEIEDDGIGFDITAIKAVHPARLGLKGMYDRINLIGGELKIDSVKGKGTRLVARVPSKIA